MTLVWPVCRRGQLSHFGVKNLGNVMVLHCACRIGTLIVIACLHFQLLPPHFLCVCVLCVCVSTLCT